MAKLIYSAIASLDGYIADEHGDFQWAAPDEEVHAFVNELERPIGTALYGRKMYEVMAAWEDMPLDDEPPVMRDFAQMWRAADKVVYSTTLAIVSSAKTRIERRFDPDAVRSMKAGARRDLSIGGPGLAEHAWRAGLIDECHMFVVPHIIGAGTRSLSPDLRAGLDLLHEQRFRSGVVYLHYRVLGAAAESRV